MPAGAEREERETHKAISPRLPINMPETEHSHPALAFDFLALAAFGARDAEDLLNKVGQASVLGPLVKRDDAASDEMPDWPAGLRRTRGQEREKKGFEGCLGRLEILLRAAAVRRAEGQGAGCGVSLMSLLSSLVQNRDAPPGASERHARRQRGIGAGTARPGRTTAWSASKEGGRERSTQPILPGDSGQTHLVDYEVVNSSCFHLFAANRMSAPVKRS
jgi:hypothetical protein